MLNDTKTLLEWLK